MNLFACSVVCVRLVGARARKREGGGTAAAVPSAESRRLFICGVKGEVFHLSIEVIRLFILLFYRGRVVQRGIDYLPEAIFVLCLALIIHAIERVITNPLCKSTRLIVLQLRYP